MSFLIFLRRSISSVSWVRPSASKAFGVEELHVGLVEAVSETDSSSSPFWASDCSTPWRTRLTNSPRFSCISSMVISAGTARNASTKRPSEEFAQ